MLEFGDLVTIASLPDDVFMVLGVATQECRAFTDDLGGYSIRVGNVMLVWVKEGDADRYLSYTCVVGEETVKAWNA